MRRKDILDRKLGTYEAYFPEGEFDCSEIDRI